jgi:hypothetical protein
VDLCTTGVQLIERVGSLGHTPTYAYRDREIIGA